MAHVQISAARRGPALENGKTVMVKVDGVDLTDSLLADGLGIEWPQDVTIEDPIVVLRLAADVLDIDLPQSLLDAVITQAGA